MHKHDDNDQHTRNTSSRPTVCVIGCGPGGMFFLHALAMRRHKLNVEGDFDGLASLPDVICYERSSKPGGVWRSNEGRRESSIGQHGEGHRRFHKAISRTHDDDDNVHQHDDEDKKDDDDMTPSLATLSEDDLSEASAAVGITNMYESLWTNGNKEPMEFFDYTFDDHFQRPIPVFMPRKHVLDYMLHRVTSKEDIFQKYVSFNTTVISVSFHSSTSKFLVSTSAEGGVVETKQFDKVIWAGGKNGLPNLPQDSHNLLRTGGFKGELLHSTEVHDLDTAACGKRLVFIGDNYSAEDLALTSLKLGAEKVYISSRGGYGTVCYVNAWPGNRVEILKYMLPSGVTPDGNGIVFHPAVWNYDTDSYEINPDGEPTVIEDVSTVIFCTGYKANLDYIEPELRPCWKKRKLQNETLTLPDGWKMKQNILTDDLGNVEPSTELKGGDYYVRNGSGIYRHLLMSNPGMMYLYDSSTFPLLELDVSAWLCLGYICGDVEIPSFEEMKRRNIQQLVDEMSIPYLRNYKDSNYYAALTNLPSDHWYNGSLASDKHEQYAGDYYIYEVKMLARDMTTGGYPANFGTYEKLTSRGQSLVTMTLADCRARYVLPTEGPENVWRTFRDCDPSDFKSYFTGTEAAPLEARWMDLDEEGHAVNGDGIR